MKAKGFKICFLFLFGIPSFLVAQSEEYARFNVRTNIFSLATGVELELGYRFSDQWEVNARGKWYYADFFSKEASWPSPFPPYYVPANGLGFHASLEKRMKNGLFSIGGIAGYKQSEMKNEIEITSDPIAMLQRADLLIVNQERLTLAGIGRFKTKHRGFFFELLLEIGADYNFRYESTATLQIASGELSNTDYQEYQFLSPHFLFGLNIGMGF